MSAGEKGPTEGQEKGGGKFADNRSPGKKKKRAGRYIPNLMGGEGRALRTMAIGGVNCPQGVGEKKKGGDRVVIETGLGGRVCAHSPSLLMKKRRRGLEKKERR